MEKLLIQIIAVLLLFSVYGFSATIPADPSNYKTQLGLLQPGDRLELAGGNYPDGLQITGINGTPTDWIIITGPSSGTPATFLGDPGQARNTVEITDSSYVGIEYLTIDGQNISGVFGISAKGGSANTTHHIRIKNCILVRHSAGGTSQQTVGISTKCPTYAWTIQSNIISDAGTGMYLGNSDGSDPFIGGQIIGNLIEDPLGYCMQIKHQSVRPVGIGLPVTDQKTIIRDNVFIKSDRASPDGDRPNLLLGHFPVSGDGVNDFYEVYGNFFYHNPRENLMQAEGRVIIHDNIFVDTVGTALMIQNHNDVVKIAYVYHNTIYSANQGIRFGSAATIDDAVAGNAVFADQPISGSISNSWDNITDTTANAVSYVTNPTVTLGAMDFYPLPGMLSGAPIDMSPFTSHTDFDIDFNGTLKGSFTFRGAYAGEGENPGWTLDNELKTKLSNDDTAKKNGGHSSGGCVPCRGQVPPLHGLLLCLFAAGALLHIRVYREG